jgi:hypothetical protein
MGIMEEASGCVSCIGDMGGAHWAMAWSETGPRSCIALHQFRRRVCVASIIRIPDPQPKGGGAFGGGPDAGGPDVGGPDGD